MSKSELNLAITKARDLFNKDYLPVIDANGNFSKTFIDLSLLLDQRDSL
jgi:hypothetical protein